MNINDPVQVKSWHFLPLQCGLFPRRPVAQVIQLALPQLQTHLDSFFNMNGLEEEQSTQALKSLTGRVRAREAVPVQYLKQVT